MKKLFSKILGILVICPLLGGNAYAGKEIIKYAVTQVNTKTGDPTIMILV